MNIKSIKKVMKTGFALPALTALILGVPGFFVTQTLVASAATTIVVTPAALDNTSSSPAIVATDGLNKWFMYNDTNDTIDNTLGGFVTGPASPFYGTGSVQFTLGANPLDRKNIATYQFSGLPLASITGMSFGVYSHSGVAGPSEDPFLNFNVDFTGSTSTFQHRLVYVPSVNGAVTQDAWQQWDAVSSGTALWSYSGSVWPTTLVGPDANVTSTPGTAAKTWSTILLDYPNARFLPVGGWLGIRVGEPGPTNYTANVDFFSIATSGPATVFDFDPTPPAPATTTVTIAKYLDGQMATVTSTAGASFSVTATWNAANIGAGTGGFSLGPVGFNNPHPYQATTADMTVGASYSVVENLLTTCAASSSYKLVGYTTGTSLALAASSTPTSTAPNFTNLTQNEYVIVWNNNCLPPPTLLAPPNGTVTSTASLTSTSWNSVTDPTGGITYVYQASNASTTNPDGSFTSPVYTSGPLTATMIPTPGTPPGVYFWHVQATDADGNVSPWSTTWMFTVSNNVPAVPTSTPRTIKTDILSALVAYRATVTNKHDNNALNEATICLQNSLNPKWWIDDSHVNHKVKKGGEVFFNEECTALYLNNLIKNHGGTVNTSTLQGFIDGLVADDRLLATTAINDAVASSGKPAFIANANFELHVADTFASSSKPVQAIDHYEPAWEWALRSLNELNH